MQNLPTVLPLDTQRPALEQAWEVRNFSLPNNDRQYGCRRILYKPVLLERRSGLERRNQRHS